MDQPVNPCHDCGGKCCKGYIEVVPQDRVYTNTLLTHRHKLTSVLCDRVMVTDAQGWCCCLVKGLCTIYDDRPEICRRFKFGSACCLDFQAGRRTEHKCDKCKLYS